MDVDRKQFAWGMGLAWVPVVLVIGPGIALSFRGISEEKATGLGAVSVGFTEFFAMFGFAAFVVCQVAGIVLLARGIGRERWSRSIVSVVSIVVSVLVLTLTILSVWWLWRLRGR